MHVSPQARLRPAGDKIDHAGVDDRRRRDVRRKYQMTGHGPKFGRKQEEAIAALLTQRNVDEAAKSIGIAPKTLLRWLKVPEFQAAYREARRATYGQAIARLQQGTSAAASTLLKVLI